VSFPVIQPASRSLDLGDFPVKNYQAMDGAEVRILYGTKRTQFSLSLGYEHLSDSQAEEFLQHYHDQQGTFSTFLIEGAALTAVQAGWGGDAKWLSAVNWDNRWRYKSAPKLTSNRPGRSSVQIELVGVV